ncbi:hypothetical protein ROZALSC1DRAFT_26351, partial [Rozella allomycis CSF55]
MSHDANGTMKTNLICDDGRQCEFFGDLTNGVYQAKHDCGMIEIKNNVTVKIVNPGYNVGVIRKLPTTTGKRKPKKVSEKVRPVAMRIPIDKANESIIIEEFNESMKRREIPKELTDEQLNWLTRSEFLLPKERELLIEIVRKYPYVFAFTDDEKGW